VGEIGLDGKCFWRLGNCKKLAKLGVVCKVYAIYGELEFVNLDVWPSRWKGGIIVVHQRLHGVNAW
jgi:hypothetical protein